MHSELWTVHGERAHHSIRFREIETGRYNTRMRLLDDLLATWDAFVAKNGGARPPYFPYRNQRTIQINRLIEDSREIEPGDCFIARVRPYSNGHPYIPQAIERGATLIIGHIPRERLPYAIPNEVIYWHVPDTAIIESWLAAAWHDFPGEPLAIIGVTGTDGKTSVTNLLYAILKAAGHKTGMISTIKAMIGDHEEPTGLHITTPQAPQIQALLHRMAGDGVTHCVLETTSMGLAERRADTAFFDTGVITNITHEHLDYHGDYATYLRDKGRLIQLASFTAVNRDDKSYGYLSAMANVSDTSRTASYGIDNLANVMAKEIEFSADATRFMLSVARPFSGINVNIIPRLDEVQIESKLLGKFNVYNMLAAATAASIHGYPLEIIKAGLESVGRMSGRMERIDEGQSCLVVVDFAHTPNALEKAIEAGRGMTDGRIITLFGSAGRRDVAKRRMMAEVSAKYADLTVLTAEDPRNDPLDQILAMMADGASSQGGIENETFWCVPDRGQAIYHALTLANDDDLVLICGKGHEQSMNFEGTEYEWDDRNATREAIAALMEGRPMPDLGLPTFSSS